MISPFGIEHGDFSKASNEVFSVVKPESKQDLIEINNPGLNGKRARLRKTPGWVKYHQDEMKNLRNDMKIGRRFT